MKMDPVGAPPPAAFAEAASLARVRKGDLCAGCGACAAIAPGSVTMRMTPPGWLRPVQQGPVSAGQDAMIARVCPGLGERVEAAGRTDDPLWGPYDTMRIGHARDEALRFSGSSGGVLSAVLVHLLETGQIDAVVQTTADPEQPIGNIATISVTEAEVQAAAGSRYAPSAPLAGLNRFLENGKRYAFVGKPCDAVAMRAWQEADPRVRASFPVILSFFCAGVPSQTGGRAVLKALDADPAEVVGFRYRGNGWPGFATAVLRDGTERKMSYHDSWGKVLSKHVQHRCKICADGTGIAADIVCADAWESDERGYPLFTEGSGTSLIVARNAFGREIVEAAVKSGHVEAGPFDVSTLAGIQPGQRERRRALLARLAALRLCLRPVPDYRGLLLWQAARQNPASRNLKNFLGTLRRTLKGRGKRAS
ncbi:Coenzyme F420 hydrogenase/dehydrogenase, beta subunit C-terminal domain [Haematobacter massiliensis]|nr:Coenzyme F420 hydrogenase/dehydrogenase, beta subunit C-terminal domain [Haematobacter massiliensis]